MRLFDRIDGPTVLPAQSRITVSPTQFGLTLGIRAADAVSPGNYRVIVRVNGQQAKNSPEVLLA